MLTFIVPVRHPENMRNPVLAKRLLAHTVISIAAQTNSDWQGVVVANHGTDLPALPPRFSVKWVDLPPNPRHDEIDLDVFKADKGRRVLSGMDCIKSDYFMTVDDDDLVSNRLAAFVFGKNSEGWCFKDGYILSGNLIGEVNCLHDICGTSHIVHCGALQEMLHRSRDVKVFGSHSLLHDYIQLETLPFPGAMYRTGHANAHSQLNLQPKRLTMPAVIGDVKREFSVEG